MSTSTETSDTSKTWRQHLVRKPLYESQKQVPLNRVVLAKIIERALMEPGVWTDDFVNENRIAARVMEYLNKRERPTWKCQCGHTTVKLQRDVFWVWGKKAITKQDSGSGWIICTICDWRFRKPTDVVFAESKPGKGQRG